MQEGPVCVGGADRTPGTPLVSRTARVSSSCRSSRPLLRRPSPATPRVAAKKFRPRYTEAPTGLNRRGFGGTRPGCRPRLSPLPPGTPQGGLAIMPSLPERCHLSPSGARARAPAGPRPRHRGVRERSDRSERVARAQPRSRGSVPTGFPTQEPERGLRCCVGFSGAVDPAQAVGVSDRRQTRVPPAHRLPSNLGVGLTQRPRQRHPPEIQVRCCLLS